MKMVTVTVGVTESDPLFMQKWWLCRYASYGLAMKYEPEHGGTIYGFGDDEGNYDKNCTFRLPGNPEVLVPNKPKLMIFGAGNPVKAGLQPPDLSRPVTRFEFGETLDDGTFVPAYQVSGLTGVSYGDFRAFLLQPTFSGAYMAFVGLFAGDTEVIGSAGDDSIETGAGDDRVVAKAGDDVVFKFLAGDLDYHGGQGRDVLDFQPLFGVEDPTTETMVVNLANGTGRNPYGGRLTLTSVEVISDTIAADRVVGGSAGERVESDYSVGDDFRLGGGNDTVEIFTLISGLTYLGGDGSDLLTVISLLGSARLDLIDPDNNAGGFSGGRVVGVERFDIGMAAQLGPANFTFRGTSAAEIVTFRDTGSVFGSPPPATAHLTLGGGDDIATGGRNADTILGADGVDKIDGGAGDDRLYGGTDRDHITGGAGDDTSTGGAGSDLFIFADGFGFDRITDFDPGIDKLDFRGHGGVTLRTDLDVTDTAAGALVRDGAGGRILLLGLTADQIALTDFQV